MNKNAKEAVVVGAIAAFSFFSGGGLAYLLMKKKLEAEYDERLQRELDASVTFLETAEKAEPTEDYKEKRVSRVNVAKPSLDDVIAEKQRVSYHTIVRREGYSPETPQEDDPSDKVIVQTENDIVTITMAEFMENESGYDQDSITYFADGGVLDDHGEMVVDYETLIGPGEPPFGEQSGESHIVYLRNNRLKREFEVVRDEANAADILADPSDTT